jgi:hypothetical protein
MPWWQKTTVAVSRTWHERTSKWKWKTRVRQSQMAKGNNQERHGELESTMASKNNCKGERQFRCTIILCCKRHKVHIKTEIVSQSKQEASEISRLQN